MPVAETREQRILQRYDKLKADKMPWLDSWQLIGEYVMIRKQNFNTEFTPGDFMTGKIFDGTAGYANHLMASSLIGALWPNGAKTFRIEPPDNMSQKKAKSKEVKAYFAAVTKRMAAVMDNPKGGFLTCLEEYMLDQGSFGISGIGVFKNEGADRDQVPIRFVPLDAKKIAIDEGADGFVDTVYIERQITVRQAVQEFGLDAVSKQVRKQFEDGRGDEKIKVLQAIEPRLDAKYGGFGNINMPVASIHLEMEHKHVLKESGYWEMPVFITRFWKANNEKYGRSPAWEAMSDILEANAMREAAMIATEKMLDPPLLVDQDGIAGGGTIDTSAGAINVKYVDGHMGDRGKVVEPLITIGEMTTTFQNIKELREHIFRHFFIDRLLDLNNETRMTLGEANIRNELRGQSLGTIYARQIAELFNRVIERVYNIMFELGLLGVVAGSIEEQQMLESGIEPLVIPESVLELMMNDIDAYKVTFISPAARIMRAEELTGIQRTIEFLAAVAPLNSEILDNIDFDEVIKSVQDLTGAPSSILRAVDEVAEMRDKRAQQQAEMAQMQAQQIGAEIAKTTSQAAQAASKAGLTPFSGGAQQLGGVA